MEKIAILADSGCQIPVDSRENIYCTTNNHYGR